MAMECSFPFPYKANAPNLPMPITTSHTPPCATSSASHVSVVSPPCLTCNNAQRDRGRFRLKEKDRGLLMDSSRQVVSTAKWIWKDMQRINATHQERINAQVSRERERTKQKRKGFQSVYLATSALSFSSTTPPACWCPRVLSLSSLGMLCPLSSFGTDSRVSFLRTRNWMRGRVMQEIAIQAMRIPTDWPTT